MRPGIKRDFAVRTGHTKKACAVFCPCFCTGFSDPLGNFFLYNYVIRAFNVSKDADYFNLQDAYTTPFTDLKDKSNYETHSDIPL